VIAQLENMTTEKMTQLVILVMISVWNVLEHLPTVPFVMVTELEHQTVPAQIGP
jgi:hypothetical protein